MRRQLVHLGVVIAVGAVAVVLMASLDKEASRSSGAVALPGTESVVTPSAERDSIVAHQPVDAVRDEAEVTPFPEHPGEFGNYGCLSPSREQRKPHTNSWKAAGYRGEQYRSVVVCAGGYEPQPRTGLFVSAQSFGWAGYQRFPRAYVPWSGPVTITDAPLGEEGSAHAWDAHLGFEGTRGVTGYLDLADFKVYVTGGPVEGVCPFGTYGTPPECHLSYAKFGRLRAKPLRQATSPGRTVTYKVKINNVGRIRAEKVKLCVSNPSNELDELKVPIEGLIYGQPLCKKIGKVRIGETKSRVFHLKVNDWVKPGKKVHLVFQAISTAPVGEPDGKQVQTTLKIRHR